MVIPLSTLRAAFAQLRSNHAPVRGRVLTQEQANEMNALGLWHWKVGDEYYEVRTVGGILFGPFE